MDRSYAQAIEALWLVFGIYWLVSAGSSKPAKRVESPASQLRHRLLLWAGYVLVLFQGAAVGPLAARYLPRSSAIELAGVLVTAAGVAFAVWARRELGTEWSASVTIKQDHHLVRRGPYAIVRNPIYTGIVTAALGTALAGGEVAGLAGLALVVIAVAIKIRTEERFLAEEFGDEFAAYRREVRTLIPFVL